MWSRYKKNIIKLCTLSVVLFSTLFIASIFNSTPVLAGAITVQHPIVNVTVVLQNVPAVPAGVDPTTYGPYILDLMLQGNGTTQAQFNTNSKPLPAGSLKQNISLTAQSNKADKGKTYQVCIDGLSPAICSGFYKAQVPTSSNVTITVPENRIADLPTSSTTPTTGTNDVTCGSEVAHLGWIVCPVIDALTNLNDYIWTLVSKMLTVNPLSQSDAIYTAWASIRSIANVLFVVFFLIIIFSQLTGAGITNYGIKKMLPKIIICAILVNISFIIVQLAVDLANIIGSSLYGFISGLAPPIVLGWGDLVRQLLGAAAGVGGGLAAIGLAAAAGYGGAGVMFWVILPFILMALLGLLAALMTLIFRQAAIPVLAILAPLAFVAYLLPNTESWYKKWQKWLLSMLMMYPLAALIFAGAQFAAATIIGNGGNFWNLLIGQIMLALPLFSLPFLIKQGGPIISGVGGALKKMTEKARKPISDYSKERRDQSAENWRDNKPPEPKTRLGKWANKEGNPLRNYRPRNIARDAAQRKYKREAAMELNKENLKRDIENSEGPHMKDSTYATDKQRVRTGDTNAAGEGTAISGQGGRQARDNLAYAKSATKNSDELAKERQRETRIGKRLEDEGGVLDVRSKTQDQATIKRVAESEPGAKAHFELGKSTKMANVATSDVATRLEADMSPEMVNLRLAEAAAKRDTDEATAKTAALVEEASSHKTAEAGSDLELVSNQNRERLQASKHEVGITGIRQKSAERVTTEDLEKSIAEKVTVKAGDTLQDGSTAKVDTIEYHETAEAARAAGIDLEGGRGVTRIMASVLNTGEQREVDEAKARLVLTQAGTDSMGSVGANIDVLTEAFASGDVAGARSAVMKLATGAGTKGREQLSDILRRVGLPPSDPDYLPGNSEVLQNVLSDALGAGIKPKNVIVDKMALDPDHRSYVAMMKDPKVYRGLSSKQLAAQDEYVLEAGEAAGGVSADAAWGAMSAEEAKGELNDNKRIIFNRIIQAKVDSDPSYKDPRV